MARTPGDWEATHQPANCANNHHEHWLIEGRVIGDRLGTVANTLNCDHCISPEEDLANAMLLAAAPQLLAACEEIISSFPMNYNENLEYEKRAIAQCRAAILLAKGEV